MTGGLIYKTESSITKFELEQEISGGAGSYGSWEMHLGQPINRIKAKWPLE